MSREIWTEQLSARDFSEPTPKDTGEMYDAVDDFLGSQIIGKRELIRLSSKAIEFRGLSTYFFVNDPGVEGDDERDYGGEICVAIRLINEVEEDHELEVSFSARSGLDARLRGEELDAEQTKAWVYLGINYAVKLMEYKAGGSSGHMGARRAYRFLSSANNHLKTLLKRHDEDALALAPPRSDQDWIQFVRDANSSIVGIIDEEDTTDFHYYQEVAVGVVSSGMPPVAVLHDGKVGFCLSSDDEVKVVSDYASIENDDEVTIKDNIRIVWHGVRNVIKAGEPAYVRFREGLAIVDDQPRYEAEQSHPFELEEKNKQACIGDLKRFVEVLRAANRYGIDK